MRLVPPVAGGFRRVLESCEFNNYQIPEGWMVLYQINQLHKDSSIYSNPQEFDPDRFSLDRAEDKPKPFTWIPFGGGARECVGKAFAMLALRVFTAHLVQGYDWELLPDQNLEFSMIPTPSPRDGLRVKFSRRG
ncbi:cytochrome P450 [Laspinema palackyanum]|uniref:cytochrome P450 n=1 Tax=Laspinema palackyanum TaxID=3231601 RepID=UPI00349F96C2